jgi:homoserine O-succinyltransferase
MNAVADLPAHGRHAKARKRSRALRIGLVNNMPDTALARTELQFGALLDAASDGRDIALMGFSLGSVPRSEQGREYLSAGGYCDLRAIAHADLDAVIVTGTEPKAGDLRAEPYWSDLAWLFDWIEREGPPAIFSCLAAHAAVLHYDDVARRRLERKRFGRFAHYALGRHPLTRDLPAGATVAHSRWNELDAEALFSAGYRILSVAPDAGVELFLRESRHTQVFFQGHPEYDGGALAREYRRDVRRFLCGESHCYPSLPEGVFGMGAVQHFAAFERRAHLERDGVRMTDFPSLPSKPSENAYGVAVYRAFLSQLEAVSVEERRVP